MQLSLDFGDDEPEEINVPPEPPPIHWDREWVVVTNQYYYNGHPLWWVAGSYFADPTEDNVRNLCDIAELGDAWARATAIRLLAALDSEEKMPDNDHKQVFYRILHEWQDADCIEDLTVGSELKWDDGCFRFFKNELYHALKTLHQARSKKKNMQLLQDKLSKKLSRG